ncbi:MAG: hypothetical protein LBV16_04970 [Elusimicrobiota bacterium]|nr:hypothetical protein [Elusimicrobiota bacterium]
MKKTTTNNNFVINGQYNDIDSDNIADLGFVFGATSATFKNVNFLKFKDSASGGAIDISGGEITIIGSKFQNNNAITNGGAINITDGKLAIIDANFTGNSAGASGGAIYADGTSKVLIKTQNANAIFENNQANGTGNDIYAAGLAEIELNIANNKTITMKGGIGANYKF